ncbi:MAG: hypothetical protein IKD45_02275 [Clostridia bacterium]|nr:hypothetical protein [Clostridia bacterium]
MKKVLKIFLILSLALSVLFIAACNKTPADNGNGDDNSMEPDEILIALSNIEMTVGDAYSIPENVIIDGEARKLTYTTDDAGVRIEGGKLVALTADTENEISATANGFSVTFSVKVTAPVNEDNENEGDVPDNGNEGTEGTPDSGNGDTVAPGDGEGGNTGTPGDGTPDADPDTPTDSTPGVTPGDPGDGDDTTPEDIILALSDITMNIGDRYSLPEYVTINGTERALTYVSDNGAVAIEGGKLLALSISNGATVTATAEGFTTTFTVKVVNYGKLTVKDVVILRGMSAKLDIEFSDPAYESEITYSFDTSNGYNIRIKDGEVSGILPNTETIVVAKTPYHTEVFVVTVLSKDLGKMTIDPPASLYTNYPAKDLGISFADDRFASAVTFEYNSDKLIIENGTIKAVGTVSGTEIVEVTASSLYDTVTFTVAISTYNKIYSEEKVSYYEKTYIKDENKGGIIFVGDSYFDGYPSSTAGEPPFWKDFYTDWAGEKAFLFGISQSQIDTLEIVSERVVYPMEPSEIVIHIGFNDVHHSSNTPEHLADRILALAEQYKERLPEVKVYFIGVEPKKNGYEQGDQYYYSSTVKAKELTNLIKDYAEKSEWFTYVDTMPIFVNENGTINKSSYLSTDMSHPTLEAYDAIRAKINEARGVTVDDNPGDGGTDSGEGDLEITDPNALYINNLNVNTNIDGTGKTYMSASGSNLINYYVISGKLTVTDLQYDNAHLQFRFSGADRFLLWDASKDGKLGAGYINNSVNKTVNDNTATKQYDANSDLTLEWAVVVTGSKAYWYINGELAATFDTVSLQFFNIGALQMNAVIYDVTLTEKAVDATAYAALLTKYGVTE